MYDISRSLLTSYLSPMDAAGFSLVNTKLSRMNTDRMWIDRLENELLKGRTVSEVLGESITIGVPPMVRLILTSHQYSISYDTLDQLIKLLIVSIYNNTNRYSLICGYLFAYSNWEVIEILGKYDILYEMGTISNVIYNPNYRDHNHLKLCHVLVPSSEDVIKNFQHYQSDFALSLRVLADDSSVLTSSIPVIGMMFRLGKYDMLKHKTYDSHYSNYLDDSSITDPTLFIQLMGLIDGYRVNRTLLFVNRPQVAVQLGMVPDALTYSILKDEEIAFRFLDRFSYSDLITIFKKTPLPSVARTIHTAQKLSITDRDIGGVGSATVYIELHPNKIPTVSPSVTNSSMVVLLNHYGDINLTSNLNVNTGDPTALTLLPFYLRKYNKGHNLLLRVIIRTQVRLKMRMNVLYDITLLDLCYPYTDPRNKRILQDIVKEYPFSVDWE